MLGHQQETITKVTFQIFKQVLKYNKYCKKTVQPNLEANFNLKLQNEFAQHTFQSHQIIKKEFNSQRKKMLFALKTLMYNNKQNNSVDETQFHQNQQITRQYMIKNQLQQNNFRISQKHQLLQIYDTGKFLGNKIVTGIVNAKCIGQMKSKNQSKTIISDLNLYHSFDQA